MKLSECKLLLVLIPGLVACTCGTYGWWPLALGIGLAVGLAVYFADDIFSPVSVAFDDVVQLRRELNRQKYMAAGGLVAIPLINLAIMLFGVSYADALRSTGTGGLAYSGVYARYVWLRWRWRRTLGHARGGIRY